MRLMLASAVLSLLLALPAGPTLGATAASGAATAANPGTAAVAPSQAALLLLVSKHFPDIHFRDIHPSETIPGWFELGTDSELVYSDPSGDHLFVGYVVDAHSRENLTAKRWNELTRIDYGTLPLGQAIKTVRGDGSRHLAVFEDPLCPFCRQLERNIADLTDVTIYTFLFPLESLHPGSTVISQRIWCSSDRAAAWTDWMQRKPEDTATPKSVDGGTCDGDPIARNRALGQQLRINATPTLVFEDGSHIASALSKDEVEKHLGKATGAQVAAAGGSGGH